MLASTRVISSTGVQARRHAHSPPWVLRQLAVAPAPVRRARELVFARQALGTDSAEEASSQQSQPVSQLQGTQPASQEAQSEQPVGEQTLQV
jgi:hypothetical protein